MSKFNSAIDAEIDFFAEAWKLPYSIDDTHHLVVDKSLYVVYEVEEEGDSDISPPPSPMKQVS